MPSFRYSYKIGRREVRGTIIARDFGHAQEQLNVEIDTFEFNGNEPYKQFHVDDLQLTEIRPEPIIIPKKKLSKRAIYVMIGVFVGFLLATAAGILLVVVL